MYICDVPRRWALGAVLGPWTNVVSHRRATQQKPVAETSVKPLAVVEILSARFIYPSTQGWPQESHVGVMDISSKPDSGRSMVTSVIP
jgi:hypothetical protein